LDGNIPFELTIYGLDGQQSWRFLILQNVPLAFRHGSQYGQTCVVEYVVNFWLTDHEDLMISQGVSKLFLKKKLDQSYLKSRTASAASIKK
jgi:hypothetical protein